MEFNATGFNATNFDLQDVLTQGCESRVAVLRAYEHTAIILSAVLILSGLFLSTLGYRLYRCSAFLCAFLGTSGVVFIMCLLCVSALDTAPMTEEVLVLSAVASVVVGAIAACCIACCLHFAALVIGAFAGILLGFKSWAILLILASTAPAAVLTPLSSWYTAGAFAAVGCVAGACAAMKCLKVVLICFTAVCGAILVVFGAQMLAALHWPQAFCSAWPYSGLCASVGTAVCGIAIQSGCTGTGTHHESDSSKTHQDYRRI